MHTILVPVDFSSATRPVVRAASELAHLTGLPLALLHVVPLPSAFESYGLGSQVMHEILQGSEKVATVRLAELARTCRRRSNAVRTLLQTGKPAPVILAQAEELDARYLVVGSHGHGAVFELLIGSTTQRILREAPCPVLVVPVRPVRRRTRRRLR